MTNRKRLVLSLPEEDLLKLDLLCNELGMNRSQYIRYVISGRCQKNYPSIACRDLLKHFSSIDLSLRVLALKESVSNEDKLDIYHKLQELKRILCTEGAFGQLGQSSTMEEADGRKRN